MGTDWPSAHDQGQRTAVDSGRLLGLGIKLAERNILCS